MKRKIKNCSHALELAGILLYPEYLERFYFSDDRNQKLMNLGDFFFFGILKAEREEIPPKVKLEWNSEIH